MMMDMEDGGSEDRILDVDDGRKEVRRPMNAFLIFCKRHRTMVREKNPDLDNRNVTRILGDLWANLSDKEKTMYTDLAKQYKDAFMKANPDYKWHNPEKLHPITKMITRPTNVRVLKEEPDIPMDTCIVPGKLADPSAMGGLSLLLMAGQRSLSPRRAAFEAPSMTEAKPRPGVVPPDTVAMASSSLLELAEMCSSVLVDKSAAGGRMKPRANNSKMQGKEPDLNSDNRFTNICSKAQDISKVPKHDISAPVCKMKKESPSMDVYDFGDDIQDSMTNPEKLDSKPVVSEETKDDNSIMTCGKTVMDHIIDRLFSRDQSKAGGKRKAISCCNRSELENAIKSFPMKQNIHNNNTSETLDHNAAVKDENVRKPTLNKNKSLQSEVDMLISKTTSMKDFCENDIVKFEESLRCTEPPFPDCQDEFCNDLTICRKRSHSLDNTAVRKVPSLVCNETSLDLRDEMEIQSEARDTDSLDQDRGDEEAPVIRKSRRRNRGQRYQELINEGIIQPSKERLAALRYQQTSQRVGYDDEENDFDSAFEFPQPIVNVRRVRKRTTSEIDGSKSPSAQSLEDSKKYKTGDFDLEAQIATLPVCSLDTIAKGNKKSTTMKQRHNSDTAKKQSSAGSETGHGSENLVLPPHLKLSDVGTQQPPPVGSRKRKARKHSITHLHSTQLGNDMQDAAVNQKKDAKISNECKISVVNDDTLVRPMMTVSDSSPPSEFVMNDDKETLDSRLQSIDAEAPADDCLSAPKSDDASASDVKATPATDCSTLCSDVLKSQIISDHAKTVFNDAAKSDVIVDTCSMSNGSEADIIKMDGNSEVSLDNSNDDVHGSPSSLPVTSTAVVTTAKVELAIIADITSSTDTNTTLSGSPSAVSLNWPISYVNS